MLQSSWVLRSTPRTGSWVGAVGAAGLVMGDEGWSPWQGGLLIGTAPLHKKGTGPVTEHSGTAGALQEEP